MIVPTGHRPTLDETLTHCAYAWSLRGTCSLAHVGAVLAVSGRALASGYNGAPAGLSHCAHDDYPLDADPLTERVPVPAPAWVVSWLADHGKRVHWPTSGHLWHDGRTTTWTRDRADKPKCTVAVHAEANAVAFAARHGVATDGATCYSTLTPCLTCAQLLVNAGVRRVVAAARYSGVPGGDDLGVQLLVDVGVPVEVLGHERLRVV